MIKTFEEYTQNCELLDEGIIPNYIDKTVKLTMDNDDGIDFSENKYIKYRDYKSGLTVFSIFRRTPLPDPYFDKDMDGNPFIYALKDINGWTFDITDVEAKQYIRKFLSICQSIEQKYDVIVMAPSNNGLNRRFMSIIYKIVNAKIKIEDYFFKLKTSDVLMNLDSDLLKKDFPDSYKRENIQKEIKKSLMSMGNDFESKKFPKEYLKYIKSVVDMNNQYDYQDSFDLFNSKNVLVLDDVFSSGKTVSDCVKMIREFEPSKIDVITLLSKKMKKKLQMRK